MFLKDSVESGYKQLKRISEGAFGEVILAEEYENPRKRVAIKLVRCQTNEEGLSLAIFREVQSMRFLDHPNIVKLYHVYPEESSYGLVMEYCKYNLSEVYFIVF